MNDSPNLGEVKASISKMDIEKAGGMDSIFGCGGGHLADVMYMIILNNWDAVRVPRKE